MNILLVEDDLFLREVFAESLTTESVTVTTAADGKEALIAIQSNQFDVILLDVFLPSLSGLQIVEQLQKTGSSSIKHILFLTNSDDPTVISQIKEFGLTYIIKSDITPDQLGEKVKSFAQVHGVLTT